MEFGAIALPLMAALGYAVASLVLKRGMALGAGVLALMVLGNWITALVFIGIFGFDGLFNEEVGYFWAGLGALGFLVGQCFSVWAVQSGEVSVQTPLMGAKTVIVALMSAIIGIEVLEGIEWLAVVLSLVAVFVISGGRLSSLKGHFKTIVLVLVSCLGFGLADISVAKGANAYGVEGFILFLVLLSAVGSTVLLLIPGKGRILEKPSLRWAFAGGALLAVQALGMNLSIGYYGKPTLTNVLYSTRGLMGVLLVWTVGSWFANEERQTSSKELMAKRFIGATLVVVSVVLMFV